MEKAQDVDSLEACLDRVRALPTIPIDDPRIHDRDALLKNIQFGNNFHLLWRILMRDVADGFDNTGASRIVALPEWEGFRARNTELIETIFSTIRTVQEPYKVVFHEFTDYLAQRNWDAIDQIGAANGHPLGLEAANIYVWDQLNPLLEAVAESMRSAGIPPEDYFS